MELKQAIENLRKESKKRKFEQTVDVIINLKEIDLKRENVGGVITIPHKLKEKKVCAFLNVKSELVSTVTKPEFVKYADRNALKELVDGFDFFIAHASLMPSVATTFGKALGPADKMPSPQLGVLMQEDSNSIKALLEKISKSVKIRAKEPSIKISIAKENMKDEQIIENVMAFYEGVVAMLPNKRENIKNVLIKFTMSKPIGVDLR